MVAAVSAQQGKHQVQMITWLSGRAGYKPVLEACGGTEVGGSYVGGSLVQPQSFSCFSTPVMANELVILDESDNPFVSFQDTAL